MNTFIYWLQQRLHELGFDPKGIDGVFGRNTRTALVMFQSSRSLRPSGTADAETVAALRSKGEPKRKDAIALPWMLIAESKRGLHEQRNRGSLMAWLRSDGRTLGDPAKLPWCGDFVETCIGLALPLEVLPANPYWARNWLKFGNASKPCYGAVLVFSRGSGGHVGFYAGEDDRAYHTLGGNQSNSINVVRVAKDRLLGARWPSTYPRGAGDAVRMTASGKLSTNEVEFITNIPVWLMSAPDWLNAIALVITAATALTALTPTKVDDEALGVVGKVVNMALKIVNMLAGNVLRNKNADDL